VEQISGSHSHYINKLLDNNCAQLQASVTSLGPNTTGLILTSAVAKKFWAVLAVLSNTSGGTVQVMSFQFEHQTSKEGQFASASDVVVLVDPDMVELVAAHQKSSVCLLCVGPVSLFQIPLHVHASDAEAYIRGHALRINDIIPDGQSSYFETRFERPRKGKFASVLSHFSRRFAKGAAYGRFETHKWQEANSTLTWPPPPIRLIRATVRIHDSNK
jgi:hypothetical protein